LKKTQSKKVLLAACDVYRPAARDQLEVLASQINVELFNQPDSDDPIGIANAAVAHAKKNGYQVVIIDTAGRLAVDEVLMDEISAIHKSVSPSETLFVVDSMTGQDAVNTAKVFHDRLNFDGVILTKLDGDTRGGAALSIKSVVDKPIKFIGTGEKLDALDLFYPDRMAERILGMGDVVSLVERAQQVFDEEQAKKIQQKVKKNSFGFDDFLAQIKQVQKMGSMKDLVGMIPGANKISPDEIDEDAFKGIEAIIQSMTPKERSQPKLLNYSRKKRIALGSGSNVEDVNRLIKQFEQMQKMMKMVQKGGASKLMQMMKGI
ncbi:MAG: signal recognition particle protein Srp54, partial [Flavobacteriales bacterium]|nr:signal recognition particle protein Srp54 [Flavobacteriales bacterium]